MFNMIGHEFLRRCHPGRHRHNIGVNRWWLIRLCQFSRHSAAAILTLPKARVRNENVHRKVSHSSPFQPFDKRPWAVFATDYDAQHTILPKQFSGSCSSGFDGDIIGPGMAFSASRVFP